jgi:peptidoglycan/LPS O-acetylase OafA/YrhL
VRYRADIDGLRAIAVLSILFYHVGFDSFGGGFVGVDVFFVISGFLITRLIKDGLEVGTFTFSNFYVRRMRRLFPALLFTLIISFLLGVFLFSPEHLERLGGAALHAIFSISNFFFWGESGYFNPEANFKPLLHTWSLGVEEQFYFVWPVLLVILLKMTSKTLTISFIVVVSFVSLYFSEKWLIDEPEASFFLAPFRVVEFGFGAILAWANIAKFKHKTSWLDEILLTTGLTLIGYSVFTYDTTTSFPGLNAVIPCLGAALAIYSGQAKYAGVFLRNPLSVKIGLISYSLYLAHWPIYVFYTYYTISPLSHVAMWVMVTASFGVAIFMYRFIETPFRQQKKPGDNKAFVLACVALAITVTLPFTHSWANEGWPVRTAESNNLATQAKLKLIDKNSCDRGSNLNIERVCHSDQNKLDNKFLIVGDSHAEALTNGVALAKQQGEKVSFTLYSSGGIIPLLELRTLENNVLEKLNFDLAIQSAFAESAKENTTVIIHARWALYWNNLRPANEGKSTKWVSLKTSELPPTTSESKANFQYGLGKTLELAEEFGAKVLIIGALPHLGNDISNCINRPAYFLPISAPTIKNPYGCYGLTYDEQIQRVDEVNEVLRKATEAHKNNARFVDPTNWLCDKEAKRCSSVIEGELIYRDDDHLSPKGALWLLRSANLI